MRTMTSSRPPRSESEMLLGDAWGSMSATFWFVNVRHSMVLHSTS